MELSKRLHAVAGLVTPGNRLADIGTDHGYIPIYLVKKGLIPHAVAMDVNRGPLQRAKEHIEQEQLEEQIETRLSDGLHGLLPGEAQTVVIAGMGGALTIKILEEGSHLLPEFQELILQPQSELERVRSWLGENGFMIAAEDMVLEDGKYYPMMRVVHGKDNEPLERLQLRYGPLLLKQQHPVLLQYLQWERGIRGNILNQLQQTAGEAGRKRLEEVEEDLRLNQDALDFFVEYK